MSNPLNKLSTLSRDQLLEAAGDAADHRALLEYTEMAHINNPHKYSNEEREEAASVLDLVILLENEIHTEIQKRESMRQRQWL